MLRYFVPNYNYPWHSIKFVVQLKKKSKNHLTKIRSVVRFLPSAPPPPSIWNYFIYWKEISHYNETNADVYSPSPRYFCFVSPC